MTQAQFTPMGYALDGALLRQRFGKPERFRQILLAMACFLLSWHMLRPGKLNFTNSDFLFVACFLILLIRNRLNLMAMQTMTAHWVIALCMMLSGLLIGSIFNGNPLRWVAVASQYLFGFLILPTILMSEDRNWIRRCLLYFVYGVIVAQIFALSVSELLTYDQASAMLGPRFVTGNGRIGGLVSDANLNGGVVAFAIIALLNVYHHGLIRLFFALCLGVVLFWSVLASASFTAFSATVIAVAVYFLCSDLGRFLRFGVPLFLVCVGYIGFGLPLPEAFGERVLGALLTGDLNQAGTYTHRTALIVDAWAMSKDTLFVGLGADEFRRVSSYGMPVHQLWLLMLTEGGLLSLLGLAGMVILLGIMGMKAMRSCREDGATVLAMLSIFVIFSISIPHMYNRLWIAPVILALAAAFAQFRAPYSYSTEDFGTGQDFESAERPAETSVREQQA